MQQEKKKKKHDKILMAKSKVNSIETLASQDSINIEISHEEFDTILKEKNKYKKKEREFEK